MPILRPLMPELLLILMTVCAVIWSAAWPCTVPTLGPQGLQLAARQAPWHAMDALMAHTRNFANIDGYPATFAPIEQELLSRNLRLGPSYWTCRKSLSERELVRWLSHRRTRLTGRDEELELLAESVAHRYLQRPGDFVYIPILPLEIGLDPGQRRIFYSDCILLAYDYPPARLSSSLFGARGMDKVQDVRMKRSGPYVALTPSSRVPPPYEARFFVDDGSVMVEQRGTQLRIQMRP